MSLPAGGDSSRFVGGTLNPEATRQSADSYRPDYSEHVSFFARMQEALLRVGKVNTFEGVTKFRALVLTSQDAGSPEQDVNQTQSRYSFRVRIPEIHSGLIDPCAVIPDDPEGGGLSDAARKAIGMHPLAMSADTNSETGGGGSVGAPPRPSVGDIVWVEFEKGPGGGRMGSPIYVSMCEPSSQRSNSDSDATPNNISLGQECRNMEAAFNESMAEAMGGTMASVEMPPSPSFRAKSATEIAEANSNYDNGNVPNKSQHTSVLNSLQPDFVPYVKSFIYRCWDEKSITIRLNSGYRDSTDQQRVRAQWEANGRVGPEPTSGLSYHALGMAIDFNPTLENGTTIRSADAKEVWLNSGVVTLAEEEGLYWGGRFRTNYDPIHVDWRGRVATSQRQTFVSSAQAAGVAPNRHRLA